jgi:hypothetical protein
VAEDFAILRDVFRFHPLALEDTEHFGRQPKIDEYADLVFLVLYGAAPDDGRLVEVHCFYSERFLVTIHRDTVPAVSDVRRKYAAGTKSVEDPSWLVHRFVDALVDSFVAVLAGFDYRIEDVEDRALRDVADEQQLQEISTLKRALVRGAQGGRVAAGRLREPGQRCRVARNDARGVAVLDGVKPSERCDEAVDIHLDDLLAAQFHQRSFGQNFGWMNGHLGGWPTFVPSASVWKSSPSSCWLSS